MNSQAFVGILQNASLMVAFAVVYSFMRPQQPSRRQQVVVGLAMGLLAILLMLTPWHMNEGVAFDTRSVLLSIAGLFFGLVPTLLATVIAFAWRLNLGGGGVVMGCLTILSSAGIGLAWRYYQRTPLFRLGWQELYALGMTVHVVMLACIFTLPSPFALQAFQDMSLPILALYPIVTVILGKVLSRQHAHFHADMKLARQLDLVERIADTSPTAIVVFDLLGKVTFANDMAVTTMGLNRATINQRNYGDPAWGHVTLQGEALADDELPFRRVQLTGQPVRDLRYALNQPDGSRLCLSANAAPLVDSEGNLESVIVTFEDITERLASATRINQLNRILRAIRDVNHLITRHNNTAEDLIEQAGTVLVDQGSYQSVLLVVVGPDAKPKAFAQKGLDECRLEFAKCLEAGELPRCCLAVAPSETRTAVTLRADAGMCLACSSTGECGLNNSLARPLIYNGVTHGYLIVTIDPGWHSDAEQRKLFADLSMDLAFALHAIELAEVKARADIERRGMEQRLKKADQLESISQLAGGVAHDFNNLLTIIIGQAELVRMRSQEPDTCKRIGEIVHASERASALTRQLLAFSRQQMLQEVTFNVNDRLENLRAMLQRILGADRELRLRISSEIPYLKADPGQFDQIFVNLAENARDAMPDGGSLTIEIDVVTSKDTLQDAPHLPTGKLLCIRVSDTGVGIAPEALPRIYDPFFTTKGLANSSGLGLSTVHGVINQFGGHLTVESKVGRGTTFTIWLMLVDAQSKQEPEAAESEGQKALPSKTILVVEDEEHVRHLIAELLQGEGYRILTAANGSLALALAETHQGALDMLITDIAMPNMRGTLLANLIRRQYPDIPVLLISGNANRAAELSEAVHSKDGFLAKPFSPDELLQLVRKALL